MNNHSDIWKNITMIIFYVICFLMVILFSKIKIEVYFSSKNLEFNYTIGIIYFKKIKSFDKDAVEKYINKKHKTASKQNKKTKFSNVKFILRYLNIEKLVIEFYSGFIDIMPTVFSIPIISIIISSIYMYLNINYDKKHYFKVKPIYNDLKISSKIHCIVSVKIAHIIYILLRLTFERRKENGKSSNRRFNEHCYE